MSVFSVAGVSGVGGVSGVSPVAGLSSLANIDGPTATDAGSSFASMLSQGLNHVNGLQHTADVLAEQAATGRLQDVHDYTIAASEAKLATELTVTVRNKAVEAFNEIMRMQG